MTDSEVQAWLHVFFDGPIFLLVMGFAIALTAVEVALVVIELVTPGGEALGALVRGLLVSAAKTVVEHWIAASIAAFAAGAILGYILPEANLAWGVPLSALGTTLAGFLVFFVQSAWVRFTSGSWAWPGGGDIAGFILSFLGFLIAWRALDLVQFGLTIGESAILGAVISLVGLGISWFSHSPIDDLAPEVGHIDEIASAGFFGFSLGRAVEVNP